jgi:hypothetical protein
MLPSGCQQSFARFEYSLIGSCAAFPKDEIIIDASQRQWMDGDKQCRF